MKQSCLVLLVVILNLYSLQTNAIDSEERKLGSFNELIVEDGITVVLIHSDKSKAVIKADGITLSDIITDMSVYTLTVKLKSYVANASVTVEIYYTDKLDILTTESGVHVFSQGKIYGDKLSINARFGGVVRIEIEAKEIDIDATNASITIKGTVKDINIHALKNAFVDCTNLVYESKDIVISGGVVKLKE